MKASAILGVLAICLSNMALADCAFPKGPDAIPDGKSASEPEMIAAMAAFKQYNADVDAYVTCLETETEAKIKETSAASAILQLKAIQQKKRSSASDERVSKVNNFNEQVRAFKARKS